MDYNQNDNNGNDYNYSDYNQNNYVQDNASYQETYQDPYQTYDYEVYGTPQSQSGMGIAGMILGICGFFINPLYICSLLALIFGIAGCCTKNAKKGCAIAGIVLSVCSLIWQIIMDFIITIFTFGLGSVTFFC